MENYSGVDTHPVEGFEVYVASGLLVLNALSWMAVFGAGSTSRTPPMPGVMTAGTGAVMLSGSAGGAAPIFVTHQDAEKPNQIIGVTGDRARSSPRPKPVARRARKTVSRTGDKKTSRSLARPPDDRPPPGSKTAPKTASATTNVVAINDAAADAIKHWVAGNIKNSTGGFLAFGDVWEAYLATGPVEVRRDDFSKVLKETLGAHRYVRKSDARGYEGIALVLQPAAMRVAG